MPTQPIGISILGSTGSIGTQTLDVVERMPERFRVLALAATRISPRLEEQIALHRPALVALSEVPPVGWTCAAEVVVGPDALRAAACVPGAEIVVAATSGHAGIDPVIEAIRLGRVIALANKETIVCAGELVMPLAAQHGAEIRPVDSEHSALWQSLAGAQPDSVRRMILTASGGPFRKLSKAALEQVTVEQALAHPTWNMGGKVTIDSASLMNKGLEVIEARWLFGVPLSRIEVVVHPESIIHSIVEYVDGSQIAQLSLPDMRLPIQYALTYPERAASPCTPLSLAEIGSLTFEHPDMDRFPLLRIALACGDAGSTYPTVMSAADDVAVEAFLHGRLRFVDLPAVVQQVIDAHQPVGPLTVESVLEADAWARAETKRVIDTRV